MPDIPLDSQLFDLAFHPSHSTVYVAQLTGHVRAIEYSDDDGSHKPSFSLRLSKRSCRALALDQKGDRLWAAGKSKTVHTVDTTTGTLVDTRADAHTSPINRLRYITPWLFASGDDDGVIKLWDPRQKQATRSYNHHFDFITDFVWLEDKKHLVATSGDGTLSVLDVRSKVTTPFAQSEDQEDELLSVLAIKNGAKLVVGTQLGILSVFNRKSGWGDCVDRIPGHPSSIDALCGIPSRYPSADSTVLTGSSDGILRAVEILPTKFVGVVADHGEFPIERIAVDRGGEGNWVGSVGHEDTLKLTDLREIFEDGESGNEEEDDDSDSKSDESGNDPPESVEEEEQESDEEPESRQKNKRKKQEDTFGGREKRARNEMYTDKDFFAEL